MQVMENRVTTQVNENVLDVCLREYGSMEYLWDIHTDNSLQVFPANLPAGYVLTVIPDKKANFQFTGFSFQSKNKEQKSKIGIQASQNVLDICLQEYGSMEYLWDVHADNGLDEFPAMLPVGYVLSVYPGKITESRRAVVILKPYCPGTGTDEYLNDTLFHDAYMHEDNYLYDNTFYLFSEM